MWRMRSTKTRCHCDVAWRAPDAAILLCHYEVARRSFVGFVERPLYLVLAADHIDILLPITIVPGSWIAKWTAILLSSSRSGGRFPI
jgi:hypothetical protein